VSYGDDSGTHCHKVGRRGALYSVSRDWTFSGSAREGFLFRRGAIMHVLDAGTGAVLREVTLPVSPDEVVLETIHTPRELVLRTRDALVVLAEDTLRLRWQRRVESETLFATRDAVVTLAPARKNRRRVLVLDLASGDERERGSVPWEPHPKVELSARQLERRIDSGRGLTTRWPERSYAMLLGGRLIVSSAAGTFTLGRW
jgi:hypothetical protein